MPCSCEHGNFTRKIRNLFQYSYGGMYMHWSNKQKMLINISQKISYENGWLVEHSRLREKSSQTKYQKNYPSKSKASFQYLYMRKVHEKILRVCFPKALGDFGPQSLLISLNSQFFIKQHREVNNTTLSLSFILWVQTLHENFRNRVDRVIFGHLGPKLGQDWPKIGPK